MQRIELHCKACNMRLMDYFVTGDDTTIALQGIEIKCTRCKRVVVLKKYTEGLMKINASGNKLKI